MKRDFAALERRRMKAAKLLDQGVNQSEVARRVGVHRQSVIRWAKAKQDSGSAALNKAGRAGRKPKLSEQDCKRIIEGLERGPEALGYDTSLWTSQLVADLIEQECGIRYTTVQAWRILRGLGWSCQRPTGKALERDEKAIRRWRRVRWPELKKTPKAKGGRSSSSTKVD